MVHIYSAEKYVNQFEIGYMINPSLHINNIFRTQVQKCSGCSFYTETMKTIKNCLLKKIKSFMELIMIYETVELAIRKVYRV